MKPHDPAPTRRRRPLRLIALIVLLVLVTTGSFIGFALLRLHGELVDAHDRVPAAARAAVDTSDADGVETLLVIGDDSRDPHRRGAADGILLVRVRDGHPTTELSISRDVLLDARGGADRGSSIYVTEGAAGLIDAVQRTLGTRIDDVVIVGFSGVRTVVDKVGGIDVENPDRMVTTPFDGGVWRFERGTLHLTGRRALADARARTDELDPGITDADRLVRQQRVASAIATEFEPDDLYRHPLERPRLALGAVATTLGVRDGVRIARAVSGSDQLGCRLGGERRFLRTGETPKGTSNPVRRDGYFVVASRDDVRQLWRMVTGAAEPDVVVRSTYPSACAVGDEVDDALRTVR